MADLPPILFRLEKAEPLTDGRMKEWFPIFVDHTDPDDHKCGNCKLRYGGKECTIVEGPIDFANGTCTWWNKGTAASATKAAPMKMAQKEAGYVEAGVVNCGSCRFFEAGYCKLWQGKVKVGQCCMTWSSQ